MSENIKKLDLELELLQNEIRSLPFDSDQSRELREKQREIYLKRKKQIEFEQLNQNEAV